MITGCRDARTAVCWCRRAGVLHHRGHSEGLPTAGTCNGRSPQCDGGALDSLPESASARVKVRLVESCIVCNGDGKRWLSCRGLGCCRVRLSVTYLRGTGMAPARGHKHSAHAQPKTRGTHHPPGYPRRTVAVSSQGSRQYKCRCSSDTSHPCHAAPPGGQSCHVLSQFISCRARYRRRFAHNSAIAPTAAPTDAAASATFHGNPNASSSSSSSPPSPSTASSSSVSGSWPSLPCPRSRTPALPIPRVLFRRQRPSTEKAPRHRQPWGALSHQLPLKVTDRATSQEGHGTPKRNTTVTKPGSASQPQGRGQWQPSIPRAPSTACARARRPTAAPGPFPRKTRP